MSAAGSPLCALCRVELFGHETPPHCGDCIPRVVALAKSGTIASDVLMGRKPVVAKYTERVAELEADRPRRPVCEVAAMHYEREAAEVK